MEMNQFIDHTYLKAVGTMKEIDELLAEAREHQFKSVCVNPAHVRYCYEQLQGTEILIGTVIGFPLGASTLESKVFETLNAISNGADEIEMVINLGEFKQGNYKYMEQEINEVCKAALNHTVKVIVEICYLTDEEVKKAAEIVSKTDAHFIVTSTGFAPSGATVEAVRILKDNVGKKEVKAVGGVRTKEDFEALIQAGATRVGTSVGIKLIQNEEEWTKDETITG